VSFFSSCEEDAVLSCASETDVVRSVAARAEGVRKRDYEYWIRCTFLTRITLGASYR
jgi:hypothetical protein